MCVGGDGGFGERNVLCVMNRKGLMTVQERSINLHLYLWNIHIFGSRYCNSLGEQMISAQKQEASPFTWDITPDHQLLRCMPALTFFYYFIHDHMLSSESLWILSCHCGAARYQDHL